MKTANYLIGLAATALLGSLSVAQAAHLPSPCGAGEIGAGTNCMYLVATGNVYDGGTGDRSATTSLSFDIDVWMDFGTNRVQGGGFDIIVNSAFVTSLSWAWSGDMANNITESGADGGNAYTGIQFDDYAGNGFGPGSMIGPNPGEDGFQLVGTLSVTLSADDAFTISLAQPYTDATYPNCFAPGAGSGGSGCVATNFYDLTVDASAVVPLPAAVWMMIAGLGSLAGFSRRKS